MKGFGKEYCTNDGVAALGVWVTQESDGHYEVQISCARGDDTIAGIIHFKDDSAERQDWGLAFIVSSGTPLTNRIPNEVIGETGHFWLLVDEKYGLDVNGRDKWHLH
ncbi:hypothetical protein MVEG_08681 [Podila verticillata NRRL 6337]|nr:hypothetical protein MVEG_08681 [Podila verticillata NRRL 6337]